MLPPSWIPARGESHILSSLRWCPKKEPLICNHNHSGDSTPGQTPQRKPQEQP